MNEKTVRAWIAKAESDWKTGRDEMATENPATDTICFHMQQCAEKLKAKGYKSCVLSIISSTYKKDQK